MVQIVVPKSIFRTCH